MTFAREGAVYDVPAWRGQVVVVRRFFEGALELLELAWHPRPVVVNESGAAREDVGQRFVRTARVLAGLTPEVTHALGGVMRPTACDHHPSYGRAVADAGPHAGTLCCLGCGAPPPVSRSGPPSPPVSPPRRSRPMA